MWSLSSQALWSLSVCSIVDELVVPTGAWEAACGDGLLGQGVFIRIDWLVEEELSVPVVICDCRGRIGFLPN